MMASGLKTLSTVMELKLGLIIQFTMDSTRTVRNMVKVNSLGLMEVILKGISWITKSKDKAFTLGLMGENLLALGLTIKWMVKVSLPGKMVEKTKVNIKTIKNMDMVFLTGPMDVNMKDSG